jgi:tRNA1(Val) A37 N6-methylase TrmN6
MFAMVSLRILAKRINEAHGAEVDMSDVLADFAKKARDHARVPMQVRIHHVSIASVRMLTMIIS